ncbi:Arylsulfatase A [Halopenitus malekzadehii]|uniref:Arylsulfatase A n=1 Tax=Halopenitus malekzadehii TaxID=1267564 RepID=A0A1H6IIG6_9EURY|nr:sulfatase [Halopenitus malekzadehii]SEH46318.1 Arylsulfatase A [Halopenitus malekzadehii]
MVSGTKPNILFIVWDACRLDYAQEYAPNLVELGQSNVWFKNAIAPATWSLPSHASLFTGEPPHKHGVTQPSQSNIPTDLVEELSDEGYLCYGASGNGFASPLWGFDEAFDDFRSTRGPEPYVEGLDVYSNLRSQLNDGDPKSTLLTDYLRRSLSHRYPVKSLANLVSVVLNHVSREVFPPLQKVPHSVFRNEIEETYTPERNTTAITNYIERGTAADEPFFIFANYMDTHRPYAPPEDLQRKYLDESLDDLELKRLNDEIADPWEFIRRVEDGDVDDDDIEILQQLYAGEVESVDRHLGRLLDALEKNNIRDDTLVIVTSDHGENIGDEDRYGHRRFGHEASLSDDLCRVPLVISNPNLDSSSIEGLFSLADIYDVVLEVSQSNNGVNNIDASALGSPRVVCEYPALGDESFYEQHPNVDRDTAAQRVVRDSVAAYEDEWRMICESDGTRFAERDGEVTAFEEAPQSVADFSEDRLEKLGKLNRIDVDDETQEQLSNMGYL